MIEKVWIVINEHGVSETLWNDHERASEHLKFLGYRLIDDTPGVPEVWRKEMMVNNRRMVVCKFLESMGVR